jgi:hypothetical protein
MSLLALISARIPGYARYLRLQLRIIRRKGEVLITFLDVKGSVSL